MIDVSVWDCSFFVYYLGSKTLFVTEFCLYILSILLLFYEALLALSPIWVSERVLVFERV
jgi:hypothetical protein